MMSTAIDDAVRPIIAYTIVKTPPSLLTSF
jgi:hypothetical protein